MPHRFGRRMFRRLPPKSQKQLTKLLTKLPKLLSKLSKLLPKLLLINCFYRYFKDQAETNEVNREVNDTNCDTNDTNVDTNDTNNTNERIAPNGVNSQDNI